MKRLLLVAFFFCAHAHAQELLEPQQAFRPTAQYIDAKTVEVRYDIAPGHYLYRSKFAFAAEGQKIKLGKSVFPRGEIVQDEFFGKAEIYRDRLLIRLPVSVASGLVLNITSQGCAENRLCYPPTTQKVEVKPALKAP